MGDRTTPPQTTTYRFHVSVHARPVEATPGPSIVAGGQTYPTLDVPREAMYGTMMACTFEEAAARLGALPRMFIEPDGAFVWVSAQGEAPWQVDGNLYDRAGSVAFVDLRGSCASGEFDRLLMALGWPETKLMLQLVREAVFVEEADFRRLAAAAS